MTKFLTTYQKVKRKRNILGIHMSNIASLRLLLLLLLLLLFLVKENDKILKYLSESEEEEEHWLVRECGCS